MIRAAQATIATLAASLVSCGEASPAPPVEVEELQATVASNDAQDHTLQPVESRVYEAPFGPVRVTELAVEHAAHADSGALSVTYLKRQDGKLSTVREFPEAVRLGSFGRLGTWTIDDRFSTLPVIVTEGGGTWQGQTCLWTTLIELRPGGPIEVASYQSFHSNAGFVQDDKDREEIDGEIVSIDRDRSFTVRFSGTRDFEALYVREGDEYVLQGGTDRALHGC